MSGKLINDLFNDMLEWEEKTDLCLAMGTSLSGMNADRVFKTVGEKATCGDPDFFGSIIINVQCTRLDEITFSERSIM